ncbi:hypothetical protein HanXRQr2_Chr15g0690901 [Helianthus annuus]|uniref:Uncharacterized protein n=1 Tax=Helianthus annuus TaxID=4232 RepID=A0A9K3DZI4_HELAN|nr:hypothetical protein HanXRQr2_Chr15g0690901 [Helianthus annuus]KAJ0831069.1 hypothetical protein HanPSC8_Chr15g0662751 [Helianthus annuus]
MQRLHKTLQEQTQSTRSTRLHSISCIQIINMTTICFNSQQDLTSTTNLNIRDQDTP